MENDGSVAGTRTVSWPLSTSSEHKPHGVSILSNRLGSLCTAGVEGDWKIEQRTWEDPDHLAQNETNPGGIYKEVPRSIFAPSNCTVITR